MFEKNIGEQILTIALKIVANGLLNGDARKHLKCGFSYVNGAGDMYIFTT